MNTSLQSRQKATNYAPKSFLEKDILTGIVTDIVLNDNSDSFKYKQSQYSSIGTIKFQLLENNTNLSPKDDFDAIPIFPNIVCYPLIGEVVIVIKSIGNSPSKTNDGTSIFYYLPNINLFNTPSFNPSSYSPSYRRNNIRLKSKETILPYRTTNSVNDRTPPLTPPGNSLFVDNGNVRPAKIFTGDIVFQGRFGNNIRFSSTRPGANNSWSTPNENSRNGDPITIINNGIHNSDKASFIPFTENPTQDKSSIYLTTTQVLPINQPEVNFNASSEPPISLTGYSMPQILINSDRLVLAAKKDSVIIAAGQNINLFSRNVGIDAKNELSVSSNNIRLGNVNADEALMLGNSTNDLLKKALISLNQLVELLQDSKIFPGGTPAPNEPVILQAVSTFSRINEVIGALESKTNLSKTTFTV